jgi:hypothetical protein
MSWPAFIGEALGSIVSSFLLYVVAAAVLRKAPAATHGIAPGIGLALFAWGGWDDPTALPPIWRAATYGMGTALMYLLVGIVRKPRRARLPELAASLAVIGATLVSVGPAWAKANFTASSTFVCAEGLAREVPDAELSPSLRYCECMLAPIMAPYRPKFSDIWTRAGIYEFDQSITADMQEPTALGRQLEAYERCSAEHFSTSIAASMREKSMKNIAAQNVLAVAESPGLAAAAKPARDAYAACVVAVLLKACGADSPSSAHRCLNVGELTNTEQDALETQCGSLLAR